MPKHRTPYISRAAKRERNQARKGWLIIATVAAVFVALAFGAYTVDQSRGISVSNSLDSAGL